jgi:hypothetical protein
MFIRSRNVSFVFHFGVAALALILTPLPARSDDLVVNTTSDVINGDVSNPSALNANPGPDGISLREAIEAVNKVPGPHTIAISPSLAGTTLALTGEVFVVKRDGVTLQGLYDSNGQPNFTVDAASTIGSPRSLALPFFGYMPPISKYPAFA